MRTRATRGVWRLLLAIVALCLPCSPIAAQSPSTATLRVTVSDPSGAVIVNAKVSATSEETSGATPLTAQTADGGIALISGLRPGRYTIQGEFPGFENGVLKGVRLRSGDNRQAMTLALSRLEAAVTVEQDRQVGAADPRGSSFGTTLTRDQIDALSDDPAQLEQQLRDMAGPGVVIRVDSFEGGALPAKAQIRSIRISRDQFAAEYHTAGGVSIEIITQPGLGPIRSYGYSSTRTGALSARSPFVPSKGPEQSQNYGFGAGGTLVKNKSSFNFNFSGLNAYETPNLNVALANGSGVSEALRLRSKRDNTYVNGQVDYALTVDQTMRFAYNLSRNANGNQGVGGYNEPERAYSTNYWNHNLRVQHFGPIGRRAFSRTRAQLIWSDFTTASNIEAPTIRVNDAFTSGGAQMAGGNHNRTINIGSDLDYVRGVHSWRMGALVEGSWFRSDLSNNYLGTYTFEASRRISPGSRAITPAGSAIRTCPIAICRRVSTSRTMCGCRRALR